MQEQATCRSCASAAESAVIIGVYADGGVIQRNPSPFGGTWAWCAVDAHGTHVAEASGVIPARPGAPVSNNVAELTAALRALAALPAEWAGPFYSDSQVTLGRLFWDWAWRGLPECWVARKDAILGRLGMITPVLLQGHPTRADLVAGTGAKRRLPVSIHNVWCDGACTREAAAYLAALPPDAIQPAGAGGGAAKELSMSEPGTCRSCGAPVLWRTHVHTTKRAPLDPAPSPGGNCRLLPDGATYEVVSRGEVGGPNLHTNHFTTCPQAPQWSRRAPQKEMAR